MPTTAIDQVLPLLAVIEHAPFQDCMFAFNALKSHAPAYAEAGFVSGALKAGSPRAFVTSLWAMFDRTPDEPTLNWLWRLALAAEYVTRLNRPGYCGK